MSLINKMLQDLDARNASHIERAGLSPHLRALPPRKTYSWRGPALAGVGALAGAVAVWLLLGGGEPPSSPQPQLQPQPVPVPAVVAPAEPQPALQPAPPPVVPALVVPMPLEAEPRGKTAGQPASAARPAPTIGRGLGVDLSLRVDDRLDDLPTRPGGVVASTNASIDKQPRLSKAAEAADTEYRRALAGLRNGHVVEGMAGLRAALKLDSRHAMARQALLSAQIDQQLWQEAQATATEGLALEPAQSGWAMILARLQVERGDVASAAETLGQYASHAERNADYQAFYALLLHRQQRSREAALRYQAALALRPAEGRWWYGLGLALEADHRPQEAREAFSRAREFGNLPKEMAAAVEQRLR